MIGTNTIKGLSPDELYLLMIVNYKARSVIDTANESDPKYKRAEIVILSPYGTIGCMYHYETKRLYAIKYSRPLEEEGFTFNGLAEVELESDELGRRYYLLRLESNVYGYLPRAKEPDVPVAKPKPLKEGVHKLGDIISSVVPTVSGTPKKFGVDEEITLTPMQIGQKTIKTFGVPVELSPEFTNLMEQLLKTGFFNIKSHPLFTLGKIYFLESQNVEQEINCLFCDEDKAGKGGFKNLTNAKFKEYFEPYESYIKKVNIDE